MKFYELTVFMTYFNQQCVNVFNLTMEGTPAAVTGSLAAVNAFGAIPTVGVFPSGSVFETIRSIVSSAVTFTQVRCKNPYDDLDFYSVPYPNTIVGAVSGEGQSPTVAYGIRSNQTRLDIQAGQKRFVGVSEGQVGAGGIVGSSMMTALEGLADVMSNPFVYDDEGNDLTFRIVVAKKYNDPEADPPIINTYWPTEAEQLANVASSLTWVPHAATRTQTTRQYGNGR